jgi:hypothetical protein
VNGSEDDAYRLAGADAVSIEDGTVFYEASDAPADPASRAKGGKAQSRRG